MRQAIPTIAGLLLVTACTDRKAIAELSENAQAWVKSEPERYSYVLERECDCPEYHRGRFLVRATRESVIAVSRLAGADTIPVGIEPGSYAIEWIGGLAQAALQMGHPVEITFDSRFRFPSEIVYPPAEGKRLAFFRVTEFLAEPSIRRPSAE